MIGYFLGLYEVDHSTNFNFCKYSCQFCKPFTRRGLLYQQFCILVTNEPGLIWRYANSLTSKIPVITTIKNGIWLPAASLSSASVILRSKMKERLNRNSNRRAQPTTCSSWQIAICNLTQTRAYLGSGRLHPGPTVCGKFRTASFAVGFLPVDDCLRRFAESSKKFSYRSKSRNSMNEEALGGSNDDT
jgi:hypothetical protein